MTLSKRGDYVVRSALCLARAATDGEARKIREIVAEMDVPHTFASQIMADLVRAGIAVSRAGKEGGYRLARDAAQVSLLEVVEAGEGPLRAERCALGDGPCRWEAVCPLHETWTSATAALRKVLAEATLGDVLERDRRLEAGLHSVPVDSHRSAFSAATVSGVSDSVQVERDLAGVVPLLANEVLVAGAVGAGYSSAETIRVNVDPGGLPWLTVDSAVVPSLSLGRSKGAGGRTGVARSVSLKLSWDVPHQGGVSSMFEGTLSAVEVDSERCELRLEGRFRPPAPVLGSSPLDKDLSGSLAKATIRGFLRRLAEDVEKAAPIRL